MGITLLILRVPGLMNGREFWRSMKSVRFVTMSLALVGTFVLSGCSTLIAPKIPKLLSDKESYAPYSWKEFRDDRSAYETALLKQDATAVNMATYYRNKMLWSVIIDIDYSYYTFRTDFAASRASIATFSDMAKLGMSAAATVLGGSSVLSAAVTALEGSQLSVDKNFLEQKATENIFTTMDTLREERKTQIEKKLLMLPPSYSFEEAYSDALALFNAGCVPSALQRLAAEAGQQQMQAKLAHEDATELRVQATLPEVTADLLSSKQRLNKIITDIVSRNDLEGMKKLLKKRNISFDANAPAADLAGKVGSELRNARTPAQITEMVNQFKELDLWKD
jgi:hypothetical protein